MISLLLHNSFHSHHASLKNMLIEELELELAETNCHIYLMKTRYPYGFQALRFIEKRSDTPGYFSMITILGRQRNRKIPFVLLLCRNSIIHIIYKQNKTQALLPLPPPMPHPTFQTPPQFPLLLYLIQ